MPTRIVFDLGGKARVSPPLWPDRELEVQPGDLSKFAPHGNGVYGFQGREGANLFTSAPRQEPNGGVIYFANDISKDDFDAMMRIFGVHRPHRQRQSKDYAIFAEASGQPGKDGYLTQMRIVSKFGLRFMYRALDEAGYETFPDQDMTMVEALWAFIMAEKKRWGTSFMDDEKNGLGGLFGGDGDFAREELSFGFMVENDYNHIYRIWSRAWLVTK
jgi:hypothetical protein